MDPHAGTEVSRLSARLAQRLARLLEETKQRLSGSVAARGLEHANVPILAAAVQRRMTAMAELIVAPELRGAVLDRPELAALCGLGTSDGDGLSATEARTLRLLVETEQQADPPVDSSPLGWPPGVAPPEVAAALERTGNPDAALIAAALRRGWITPVRATGALRLRRELFTQHEGLPRAFLSWSLLDSARLVDVERRVREDRHIPAITVDAGEAHHALLVALRDLAGSPRGKTHRSDRDDGIPVLAPGDAGIQLSLRREGEARTEVLVDALRRWRGGEGLWHWAAVQRLLSIEGGRTGRVRWTLERHLDALGASRRSREDPRFRARAGQAIALFTRLEFAVPSGDAAARARRPVLARTARYAPIPGSELAFEGTELELHPALRGGVRDAERSGDGYPQIAELPRLDHVHHPHLLALGLILPILWRRGQSGDHTRMNGLALLETAGIPFQPRRASEAWSRLRRDLAELQRVGALDAVEWEGTPWTGDGSCLLYPPQWTRDRAVHHVLPIEPPSPAAPLTGAELIAWRRREGHSQADAARRLGVGLATVKRAEAAGKSALGPALVKAFARLER